MRIANWDEWALPSGLDCAYDGMLEVNENVEMNSRVATRTLCSGIAMDIEGSRERREENDAVNEAVARLQTRYACRFIKRLFDIVFSPFVLIPFLRLFLIIGIVVKIEDPNGSIVFKQERVTKDGKKLNMYKFRSMCSDARGRLADLREFNEKTDPVFKVYDDPWITRVGKVIRKLSLDSVIIGTPGDGESAKFLLRSANSSLDLKLRKRRPELCRIASNHNKRFRFLSVADCRDIRGVLSHAFAYILSFDLSASFWGSTEGCSFSSLFPLYLKGGEMQ